MVGLLNRLAGNNRIAYAFFALVAWHRPWRNASEELRFLSCCAGLRHLAQGQLLQDLWTLFDTDFTPGYFVEFGACNGRLHSNTLLHEQRFGWRGLLAEPNPAMVEVFRGSRSAIVDDRCVWDHTGEEVELLVTADPELSTVADAATPDLHTGPRIATAVRRVRVPTVSSNDL